jgi:hypothetical protein
MDLPSKHVLNLSKRLGARGAESDREKSAAAYISHVFSDFDIDVDEESFSSWKSEFTAIMILFSCSILAYLAFYLNYALSLVISILVFLLFQMETYSWAVISKLLHHSGASNIIGRVAPAESTRQTVLLVANYDSTKSSPLGGPRLARAYRFLYIISFISIIMIGILGIAGLGADLLKISRHSIHLVWLFGAVFPAYLLIMTVLIAWGEVRGTFTAGANDNASGVGVMLSLVATVASNPLKHTAVWGVATARGAAGGRGMVELLKKHRRTLKSALIINLDHPGRGETRVITREGVMFGFHSSRRLSRLALRAAKKSKSLKITRGKNRVKKSDAMVANVRGFRAITIGGARGGTYDGWRSTDDTYDRIQRASLDRAVTFVEALLEEIDGLQADASDQKAPRRRRKPDELESEVMEQTVEHLEEESP